jgi:dihydroorotase
MLQTMGRNTPFAGRRLPGRAVATFLRGSPTALDGVPVDDPPVVSPRGVGA